MKFRSWNGWLDHYLSMEKISSLGSTPLNAVEALQSFTSMNQPKWRWLTTLATQRAGREGKWVTSRKDWKERLQANCKPTSLFVLLLIHLIMDSFRSWGIALVYLDRNHASCTITVSRPEVIIKKKLMVSNVNRWSAFESIPEEYQDLLSKAFLNVKGEMLIWSQLVTVKLVWFSCYV